MSIFFLVGKYISQITSIQYLYCFHINNFHHYYNTIRKNNSKALTIKNFIADPSHHKHFGRHRVETFMFGSRLNIVLLIHTWISM